MLFRVSQKFFRKRIGLFTWYSSDAGTHFSEEEEFKKFHNLSQNWWDENGVFKALHSLNQLRIPLIRDRLLMNVKPKILVEKPLKGFRLLDIGCGGGILSEPLARLGACIIGIDPVEENVKAAYQHLSSDLSLQTNLKYITGKASDLLETEAGSFDGIIASEVLEHAENAHVFVKSCSDLVKPNGLLFFTTLNRTWLSYLLGIVIAEYILQLVPRGIHSWNKFLTPEEVMFMLDNNHCRTELVHGMAYNPLTNRWSWSADKSINYALVGIKLITEETEKHYRVPAV